MSTTNALKLFKVLKARKSASGLLSDPGLERITQMGWEDIKSCRRRTGRGGLHHDRADYTIAEDLL